MVGVAGTTTDLDAALNIDCGMASGVLLSSMPEEVRDVFQSFRTFRLRNLCNSETQGLYSASCPLDGAAGEIRVRGETEAIRGSRLKVSGAVQKKTGVY